MTVPGAVATAGSDSAALPVAAAVPLSLAAAFVVSVGAVVFVPLAVAGSFGAGLLIRGNLNQELSAYRHVRKETATD